MIIIVIMIIIITTLTLMMIMIMLTIMIIIRSVIVNIKNDSSGARLPRRRGIRGPADNTKEARTYVIIY